LDNAVTATTSMVRSITSALSLGEAESLRRAINAEQINNRLCLLMERHTARNAYVELPSASFKLVFAYKLENLADSLRLLCQCLLRSPNSLESLAVKNTYGTVSAAYASLISFYT